MKRVVSFVLTLAMLIGMMPMMITDVNATASAIKTNLELVERAKDVVHNYKTLYVMAGWGQPLTAQNKERLINKDTYNQKPARTSMINAASSDTFAFDCVCFIKALLWGWDGDLSATNGGAVYKSNGVADPNANGMIDLCKEISTDFSDIEVGEVLWMKGHVGLYIGDGLAIECTPDWKNGVQITACNQTISGYNTRYWTKHGKLPYIDYIDPMVRESYPCYGWIQIKSDTSYVKSLPCSDKTDPNSVNVESEPAKKGDTYLAIGLVRNTATEKGNLWYKVIAENKKTGYIYAGDTEYLATESDLELTGVNEPKEVKKGNTFPVTGVVSTQYRRLREVHVFIQLGTDGTYPSYARAYVEVDTTRYDLSNKDIDYNVHFEQLPVGRHTYYIAVDVRSCYAKSGTEMEFTKTDSMILKSYTFDVVEDTACKHTDKTSTVTAATCTAQGYTTYTCKSCGYSYKDNYTDKKAHSYGEWTTATAATCTADGTEQRACTACGNKEERTINAWGHKYESVVTEPTCTEQGYTTYTCSVCGDQYKGDYIDGPGHNYQAERFAATCMEYGRTVYTCTKCAHSYTEYDGDLLTDWSTTKPTGVDESLIESRTEYRTRVKEFTTGTTNTMSGWTLYDSTTQWSDYGEWSDWSDVVINESETTQVEEREAYKYYYYPCPACGVHMHGWGFTCPSDWGGGCGKATLRRDDYVKIWSDISYEDAKLKDFYGTGKYYTTIDGQRVFASSSNPITQYRSRTRTQETVYKFYKWSDWSDWSISEATATDHMEVETRTVYRYVEAELADHKYESTVKEPTCTEKGYTTHTCSVCKDSYTDSETPALGHDYEYSIPVWPTTAAAGKLKDVCKNCQDTVTVTLPQLNEVDYTYKVMKEPTYTAEGSAMYTWKNTEYGNISFSVQLDRLVATLSEIKIASNPVKTMYEIGEELDTTGLTLTAVYTDGSEKTIATGFTVSGFDSETAGEKTVTVTYEGKTATFTVEVEAPIVSSAKYVIADAEATAGSTVEVYVEIANNPGIVSLRNKISYDTTALELVKVEDTEMLVGYTTPAATIQSPYILRWADSLATKNNEANGKIVKLTFRIKEDAKEGQYEISVEHVESRNVDGKKITFAKATAKINVIDYVMGDIDGDGEVSDWDAILLNRYLAGWDVQIILEAADIDSDGEVSDWDAIVLERYLAGWNVTLG